MLSGGKIVTIVTIFLHRLTFPRRKQLAQEDSGVVKVPSN